MDSTAQVKKMLRERILRAAAILIVLLIGGIFRFTGLMWGDYAYPHPDERFLVWVVADIAPVDSLGQYFDTAVSSLNPANRGHAFYVYGDFPVILARYVTEWAFDFPGWEEILQVSRTLSAVFDLGAVLLVFLIAERLAGWRVGALAGLFSAAAVLQIQQSHFFTVDTFATFFTTLAIYFAVRLVSDPQPDSSPARFKQALGLSVLFGAAVGLAMACKLNTVPVAGLLPAALAVRCLRGGQAGSWERAVKPAGAALLGGLAAFLVFRLAQPYAFSGPGLFGLGIDEGWLRSIRDLSAQSAGDVDFPPALQWARRAPWFSLQNLALWGLGLPLAAAAWLGFGGLAVVMVRRLLDGGWRALVTPRLAGSLLVWAWTAFYFTWQSLAWNPTMRYQLPIYPALAILAAWGLGYAWNHPWRRAARLRRWRVQVGAAGALVLALTLAWAFAFTRVYTRTETRLAASYWIYEHVPGPINLEILTGDETGGPETTRLLVGVPERVSIAPGQPYLTIFDNQQQGVLEMIRLPRVQVATAGLRPGMGLGVRIYDPDEPQDTLAGGWAALSDGDYESLDIPADNLTLLEPGRRYGMALEISGPDDQAGQDSQEGLPASGLEGLPVINIDGQISLHLYGRVQEIGLGNGSSELSQLELKETSTLRQVWLPRGVGVRSATVILTDLATGEQLVSAAQRPGGAALGQTDREPLTLINPLTVRGGASYLAALAAEAPGEPLAPGLEMWFSFMDGSISQFLPAIGPLARLDDPLLVQFSPQQSGLLRQVTLGYAAQVDPAVGGPQALALRLENPLGAGQSPVEARLEADLRPGRDPRGAPLSFTIDPPAAVQAGQVYTLTLAPESGGALAVRGSAPANESTWDMGLPFRTDGYDPYGGIYRRDLNFEMYWDDNADKYQRFVNILDQADYIFISSNRQWGTTTRLPERHPLNTAYYRDLLGCPVERQVIWCYNVAEPGLFGGRLGFDLVQTFTSYPNLGPVEINTQFAEEAFTVYDHPKVFVFQKRSDYDSTQVQAVLGEVDLQRVVRITPKRAADFVDMLLPAWMWRVQMGGGTWASLFPPEGLQNRYPAVGLVVWYLFLLALGLLVYPLVRLALPGLADRGYPLARAAGLVLLAYPAWLGGSLGAPVTRLTVAVVFGSLALLGLGLAFLQRAELAREWRAQRRYFLRVELLALGLFAFSLLIRLGNPDLWHPIYGGEKPMDFSHFNAVLKSTLFPPYDPWFAGGSLNYYYYGYVLVGMPVKLLGITPAVAYNLILPALFSIVGLAAFSIGWNLLARRPGVGGQATGRRPAYLYWAGLAAVAAVLILGNLGTVRMLWQGPQRLIVSDEQIREGSLFQQAGWFVEGVGRLASGQSIQLPYSTADWYWKPSRAIQPEAGNEITEFPFFTFLYADLHAHLMALPVTLLVIGWSLSAWLAGGCWGTAAGRLRRLSFGLSLLLGALAVGALRPANTWDQYTYLTFAALALAYGQRHSRAWPRVVLPAAALVGLALALYSPFNWWFGQAYNALVVYEGPKTQIGSYLVHWGLFLFVIAAWLFDEAVDWLAATPLAAVHRLAPYRGAITAGLVALALALVILLLQGVAVALVIGPLGLLAAVLLLRPGQPEGKRLVLFMIGAALLLTLAVELVAVRGDLNRMNTVFKFYFQAWTLLGLSAAAAAAWLWAKLPGWNAGWRWGWLAVLGMLVLGAALYPITAARTKIVDRVAPEAPHTLDGMAFMAYTRYGDGPTPETYQEMDLAQDDRAIRWVQQNVPGSPVIAETHTPEYRHWGTRFTIYTGLPGVIGWNWHERQQRALTPDTWIYDRIEAVHSFYRTTSREQAEAFLRRYDVGYIVVGQLEQIYYPETGLDKFAAFEGDLWKAVYQDGDTIIYKSLLKPIP